ncbi:tRNA uridine-5-carboxymethylaminomethyl(34) synthesis GTPase MnmE [Proteinivorax hydrogeniformans]|uniref:tRNA modification GTPase MnmE n=1 Tax=Proteinivorax hydrogeniformans TaxID=1826727 RepID=A0AAU8HXA8_9FIRM
MLLVADTIAAIGTALGQSGIAIVRVSGPDSLKTVDKYFISPKKNKVTKMDKNTINYGHFHDENGEVIDEVLVSVFKAPFSYTGEDVVEINCHGGQIPIKKILTKVLESGIRLAEPGEFTKRAFLNGKLDLSQAEAVMDLISAKTDLSHDMANKQAAGNLSTEVKKVRDKILEVLANIEATIDYPDEQFDSMSVEQMVSKLSEVEGRIQNLLKTATTGKLVREGIKTVIIGEPNVGKSSLLNALTKENRAIVTDIPGTTRDVLQENINVKGVPLVVLDTAGIRETSDKVEKIGVKRTKEYINTSDLVLYVIDGSQNWSKENDLILELIKTKPRIVIINKSDLPQSVDIEIVKGKVDCDVLAISAEKSKGITQLEDRILGLFEVGNIKDSSHEVTISNIRHEMALKDAKSSLEDSINALKCENPVDIVSIDIKDAWQSLGKITGESLSQNLIDEIFSRFCLGK